MVLSCLRQQKDRAYRASDRCRPNRKLQFAEDGKGNIGFRRLRREMEEANKFETGFAQRVTLARNA
jgi:hypothetical protein